MMICVFYIFFFIKPFPKASRCQSVCEKEPRGRKKRKKRKKKNLFLRGIFHREFTRKGKGREGNCLFTSVSKQIFSDSTFVQPPRLRARGGVSD